MKRNKLLSVFVFSILLMVAFIPQLSAKHSCHTKKIKSKSSFSFNLSLNPLSTPFYREYRSVTTTAPLQPVVVNPYYSSVVTQQTYYPVYQQQVVVQRPYQEQVIVQR